MVKRLNGGRRQKRQTRPFMNLTDVPADQVLLDVSGPNSVGHGEPFHNETLDQNFTIIYAKDLEDYEAPAAAESDTPTKTHPSLHHPYERTTTIYVRRSEIKPKESIMEIFPSISILKQNEVCEISSGNDHRLIRMKLKKNGVSSLQFTKKLKHAAVHRLELTCRPIYGVDTRPETTSALGIKMLVEIHIL